MGVTILSDPVASQCEFVSLSDNTLTYPIERIGSGQTPCLSVGLGSLMKRSLPEAFWTMCTLYSHDLYWLKQTAVLDCSFLTINKMSLDLEVIANKLNLSSYYLLAHSCFGLLALEATKKNKSICGVILIGSPPAWNDAHCQFTQQYFLQHAEPERKKNDITRRKAYAVNASPHDTIISFDAYVRDSARYWADYTIETAFLQRLWQGIEIDEKLMAYFFDVLLPQYDVKPVLPRVGVPVILFSGRHDYDCLPELQWARMACYPSQWHCVVCQDSGHWPHLEEPQLFQTQLAHWLEGNAMATGV